MTSIPPHLIALTATIADNWGVFVFIAALALVAVFVGRWVREWENAPPDRGESGRLGEHQKRQ